MIHILISLITIGEMELLVLCGIVCGDTVRQTKHEDMEKICNQFFVKDRYRDKQYIGTMKCAMCNQEKHLDGQFPIDLTKVTDQFNEFTNIHVESGCNEWQIDSSDIEWAAKNVTFGLVF